MTFDFIVFHYPATRTEWICVEKKIEILNNSKICDSHRLKQQAAEMSALKHITTVLANDTIPVHKYKSERTGLTVVIGEVKGPIVNGYFALGKSCFRCLINFGFLFRKFYILFYSDRSAWWWRLAAHIGAFDIFRFGIISVQRCFRFIGESVSGIWHKCLDRHRSHMLHSSNSRQRWFPRIVANLFGSHFVSNVVGTYILQFEETKYSFFMFIGCRIHHRSASYFSVWRRQRSGLLWNARSRK